MGNDEEMVRQQPMVDERATQTFPRARTDARDGKKTPSSKSTTLSPLIAQSSRSATASPRLTISFRVSFSADRR